jgi:S1-C subfamily serine protease
MLTALLGLVLLLSGCLTADDLKVSLDTQREQDAWRAGPPGPRAWLGAQIGTLTSEKARSLAMTSEKGVVVNSVTPDGPAARAGLRQGDVLLEFDGRTIGERADMVRAILSAKPGQSVTLKIWRDRVVTARLGTAPEGSSVTGQPPPPLQVETAPPPVAVAPRHVERSTASGFLLRQTNLVLTSYHVVRDRKELTLRFPSGEEYRGRVVAQDRGNDLALVEAQGLTPSSRGVLVATTAGIRIGEPVHALGYPLGAGLSRQPSMVSGTVSSTLGLEDDIARFRMTAPINPGNSGGPIVNARGQVIGVAAAGLVREGVEAVRFGIKASTAGLILQQAQVTTAFDVVVSPLGAGPRAPDQIFNELAPAVVLIETR